MTVYWYLANASILFSLFQEQYKFCYEMVRLFVDAFSDYANFKWFEKLCNVFENKIAKMFLV